MNIRVGYIPYLNMVPFHHNFGPKPMDMNGHMFELLSRNVSPRSGFGGGEGNSWMPAPSPLVDSLHLASRYGPVGTFGIGMQRAAQSVLLFSKRPISLLQGSVCAVTDETSTSFRLLQLLLERFVMDIPESADTGVLRPVLLFDGEADCAPSLLETRLCGLKGRRDKRYARGHRSWGRNGFQMAKETPFVFARWMVQECASSRT